MKRFAALCLCLLLLTSFTGCKQLDALKRESCWWEDASHMYISFRDTRYKLTGIATASMDLRSDGSAHCGEPGQPLLLLGILGKSMILCPGTAAADEPPVLLCMNGEFGGIYCREDRYASVVPHLYSAKPDRFYTTVWEADENDDYHRVDLYLDEADTAVLNRVLAGGSVKPKPTEYIANVQGTDSELLLEVWYQICLCDGGYAVIPEGGQAFPVSEEDRAGFERMLSHIEGTNAYAVTEPEPALTEV